MKYRSVTVRIFSTVIVFIFSVVLLCSCRGAVELGFNDKGSSIELKKGDTITILLESNLSTGYSWIPSEEIDTTVVSLTGSEFMQKEIILNYMRPWEDEELKDEFVFNIYITVK